MGLGSSWGGVVDALRDIIPVYDRVNAAISLGSIETNRRHAIEGRISKGDSVLDAGSGFGNMSGAALRVCGSDITLTLHDALVPMLHESERILGRSLSRTCGVFESLPFRDSQFDAAMCGYSLRDAISLRIAVSELHRVLRDGGRLIIVDLGKPDGSIARACVTSYLRVVPSLMALAIAGRRGLKFAALYDTYKKWPCNSELRSLLEEKFSRVEFETRFMGGAIIAAAYK